MRAVRVALNGAPDDLARLAQWFAMLDHKIIHDGGRYALMSPAFDACSTPQEVIESATQLIDEINSIGKLYDSRFGEVASSDMTYEDENGARRAHAWILPMETTIGLGVEEVVISADGRAAERHPSAQERVLALVQSDHAVNRVVQYFNLPLQTWGSLYSIYEIVREDLNPDPKASGVLAPLGVTREQAESFRETANSSKYTGLLSRHGSSPKKPMQYPPMTLEAAEALIRRVVMTWIGLKLMTAAAILPGAQPK